jgi:hypothetical protein
LAALSRIWPEELAQRPDSVSPEIAGLLASGLHFLVSNLSESQSRDWGFRGDAKLDTAALDELIAQVRGR